MNTVMRKVNPMVYYDCSGGNSNSLACVQPEAQWNNQVAYA